MMDSRSQSCPVYSSRLCAARMYVCRDECELATAKFAANKALCKTGYTNIRVYSSHWLEREKGRAFNGSP